MGAKMKRFLIHCWGRSDLKISTSIIEPSVSSYICIDRKIQCGPASSGFRKIPVPGPGQIHAEEDDEPAADLEGGDLLPEDEDGEDRGEDGVEVAVDAGLRVADLADRAVIDGVADDDGQDAGVEDRSPGRRRDRGRSGSRRRRGPRRADRTACRTTSSGRPAGAAGSCRGGAWRTPCSTAQDRLATRMSRLARTVAEFSVRRAASAR